MTLHTYIIKGSPIKSCSPGNIYDLNELVAHVQYIKPL